MSVYVAGLAYGIVGNPITDSPYFNSDNIGSGAAPPPEDNDFLLLDGTDFLLLDGTNFLLLES